jgi:hypothetical protein
LALAARRPPPDGSVRVDDPGERVDAAPAFHHVPVLAEAVAAWAEGGRRAVDATAGGGGHAAVLRAAGAEVLLVDRDPAALAAARARLGDQACRYLAGCCGVMGSV